MHFLEWEQGDSSTNLPPLQTPLSIWHLDLLGPNKIHKYFIL